MKSKKIIALITAGLMISTISAGCGGKGASTESDKGTNASAEAKMVGNMYVSGLPIVEKPMTFKMAIVKPGGSKNNMADKEAAKFAESQTNVKVEWQEIASAGWGENITLMFASNDIPDAIIGGSVDVAKYRSSLAPLNDLIDKYAPNVQQIFKDRPDVLKALSFPDKKIYSLPNEDDGLSNAVTDLPWINKMWLDKMSLKMPTTTDEFYSVMTAFKDKDPNGNWKQDEIPLMPESLDNLNYFFGAFGTLDDSKHVRVQDGKVIFTPSEQGYYDTLKYLNKLYSAGLMDKETFTQTGKAYKAKGSDPNIIVGMILNFLPDSGIALNLTNNYTVLPPFKVAGGTQLISKGATPQANISGFMISASCKNPEVLVRWYDFNNSSLDIVNLWNYGPEGTGAWRKLSDGKWEVATDNIPKDSTMQEFRRTQGTGPNGPMYPYTKYSDPSVQKLDERTQQRVDAVKMFLPFTPKEIITVGFDDLARVEQRSALKTDIDAYLKQFKADSIAKGIDGARWEEHLKRLKVLKSDEYVKLWQEFYDNHK